MDIGTGHSLNTGDAARRVGALLALSLLSQGCAAVPDLWKRPDLQGVGALHDSQALETARVAWPAEDWWKDFEDSQLQNLIETGLRQSPTMADATARVRKASANREGTGSLGWPSLTLNSQAINQRSSANAGLGPLLGARQYDFDWLPSVALEFNHEVDFWGENRNLIAAAVGEEFAAAADKRSAALMLSTAIALAYGEYQRLDRSLDLAEMQMSLKKESQKLVSQRVAAGLETRAELALADARLASATVDVSVVNELIALQGHEIALLIGVSPDSLPAIDHRQSTYARRVGLPEVLPVELVGRRPDVIAAMLRAQSSFKREGAARAAFYPSINLVAAVGLQSIGLERLASMDSDVAQFGAAARLPLFDGRRLSGAYRGAAAETDAAVAAYNNTLAHALKEAADAIRSLQSLGERRGQLAAALDGSERAFLLARSQYAAGMTTYFPVLASQDLALMNRQRVIDLEARQFALEVQLVKALGGAVSEQQYQRLQHN